MTQEYEGTESCTYIRVRQERLNQKKLPVRLNQKHFI